MDVDYRKALIRFYFLNNESIDSAIEEFRKVYPNLCWVPRERLKKGIEGFLRTAKFDYALFDIETYNSHRIHQEHDYAGRSVSHTEFCDELSDDIKPDTPGCSKDLRPVLILKKEDQSNTDQRSHISSLVTNIDDSVNTLTSKELIPAEISGDNSDEEEDLVPTFIERVRQKEFTQVMNAETKEQVVKSRKSKSESEEKQAEKDVSDSEIDISMGSDKLDVSTEDDSGNESPVIKPALRKKLSRLESSSDEKSNQGVESEKLHHVVSESVTSSILNPSSHSSGSKYHNTLHKARELAKKDSLPPSSAYVSLVRVPQRIIKQIANVDATELIRIVSGLERRVLNSREDLKRSKSNKRKSPIRTRAESKRSENYDSSDEADDLPSFSQATKSSKKNKSALAELPSSSGTESEVETCETQTSEKSKSDKVSKKSKSSTQKRVVPEMELSDVSSTGTEIVYSSDEGASKTKTKATKRNKRRRVVTLDSDDEGAIESKRRGRRNIKKILTEKELREETRTAGMREKERIKRVTERHTLLDELYSIDYNSPIRLVLEADFANKKPIVEVNPGLVKRMKAHQIKGVRFMYDCIIESVERLKEDGSGCILAHSMGLGKTFQVIALVHTMLTNEKIKKYIQTVLIIVPVNTIKNWCTEFYEWLEDEGLRDFGIFDMSESRTPASRAEILKLWRERGGVMIIGLSLFTQLMNPKKRRHTKWIQDTIHETLSEPGPDVVIIDEGHILKNSQTNCNKAVNSIATLRRIILTGTPLQNNLDEYYVMVHFVKPGLLGTKKEFSNRFSNPISNGQHIDSTEYDVTRMKKRVHILHKLLDGCVQRFDYGVLRPYLQPKHEFVLSIKLTEKQKELYQHYLDTQTVRSGAGLLLDFSNLRLIWNHPGLLYSAHQKRMEAQVRKEEKEFLVSGSESPNNSNDEVVILSGDDTPGCSKDTEERPSHRQRVLRSDPNKEKLLTAFSENPDPDEEFRDCWFFSMLPLMNCDSLELSSKMVILFKILDECEKIKDKVIVFSQSLDVLDFIETALAAKVKEKSETIDYTWISGRDYFRIDGSTSGGIRKSHIDKFNDPANLKARLFMLSTKAGGLGINLVGANRCVVFDASWNPTHDIQAIYRIYRFGQNKPVYIYRFIAQGTMEEKIYERQIIKQSLSVRVVDELSVGRHFRAQEVAELYSFTPDTNEDRPLLNLPKDKLLADILISHKDLIVKYHEHDSLLENKPDEDLTDEERMVAWKEYEEEKEFREELAKREEQYKKMVNDQHQDQQQRSVEILQQEIGPSAGTTNPNIQIIPMNSSTSQNDQAQPLLQRQLHQLFLQQQQQQMYHQLQQNLLRQPVQHQQQSDSRLPQPLYRTLPQHNSRQQSTLQQLHLLHQQQSDPRLPQPSHRTPPQHLSPQRSNYQQIQPSFQLSQVQQQPHQHQSYRPPPRTPSPYQQTPRPQQLYHPPQYQQPLIQSSSLHQSSRNYQQLHYPQPTLQQEPQGNTSQERVSPEASASVSFADEISPQRIQSSTFNHIPESIVPLTSNLNSSLSPSGNVSELKSLPTFDVLTVEDCLNWISPNSDSRTGFPQVFRILSNGMSMAQQESQKLKLLRKDRTLTADELLREHKIIEEMENIKKQTLRAREMAKAQKNKDDSPSQFTYKPATDFNVDKPD